MNVFYSQASDVMSWQFNIADGTDYFTTNTSTTDATTFNSTYSGQWFNIVGTYKAGEHMRIYLDGDRLTNKTTDLPSQMDPENTTGTWIGRAGINPGYINGKIDEVHIYDRALTAT